MSLVRRPSLRTTDHESYKLLPDSRQLEFFDRLYHRWAVSLRGHEQLDGHESPPDGYGCIRDIKNGPLVIFVIYQYEIYYTAQSNPIDQVAANPGRQQRQRPEQERI